MEGKGLERFIEKQEEEYNLALNEIKNGEKKSCWMWYIFPQIRGLGKSSLSTFYGIKDIKEAIEYLKNEKLKNNLIEISQALLDLGNVDIKKVMGFIDDIKLKSSMTLFNEVELISNIDCGKIFQKVLIQFFNNEKDKNTLIILEEQKNNRNQKNNNINTDRFSHLTDLIDGLFQKYKGETSFLILFFLLIIFIIFLIFTIRFGINNKLKYPFINYLNWSIVVVFAFIIFFFKTALRKTINWEKE